MNKYFTVMYNLVMLSLLSLGIACIAFPDNQILAFIFLMILFSTWPVVVLGTWTLWIYRKILWGEK